MKKRLFILGAGFSYHISGTIFPIMVQLVEDMKNKNPKLFLYLQKKNIRTDNLERMLTELDLELQNETETTEKVLLNDCISYMKSYLKNVLSIDKVNITQIENAKILCSELFNHGDTIITFNYDCLLEHILWKILNKWTPYGGYGNFSTYVLNGNTIIKKNPQNIVILKLHGSLNFTEEKFSPESYLGIYIPKKIIMSTKNHRLDRLIAVNAKIDNAENPYIILPSYIKRFGTTRTSIKLWHEAIDVVRKSEIIIIIGYSFPTSDAMSRLLLSFLNIENGKKLKIIILNNGDKDTEHVKNQIIEVGQFGYDHVAWKLFSHTTDNEYENLSSYLKSLVT